MGSIRHSTNILGLMGAFVFALVSVLILSKQEIVLFFIILGQAHFIITYLYQYKGGKITKRYALTFFALISLLAYLAFHYTIDALFLVTAGTLFAIHFFVDEMRISQIEIRPELLSLGGAFVLLYAGLLFEKAYNLQAGPQVALFTSILLALFITKKVLTKKIQASEVLITTSAIILLLILMLNLPVSIEAALGFIILFHYVRWYIFYFFKITDPKKHKEYLRNVVWVQIAVFLLFLLYSHAQSAHTFLQFFFAQTYFFGWTIVHILLSLPMPSLQKIFRNT